MSVPTTSDLLANLHFRCIGPPRGGRVVTVAGVPGDAATYYFGAVGGGVWKSDDAGQYWQNVSDGYFNTSAVGALAVAPSDANVIYAGTGEHCLRLDVSHGDGVYKSTDAGRTWTNVGLKDSRHISQIRIHPKNPDIVYVAALGHAFGPNQERGVYRTKDGGATWEQILFKSDKAGAIDLTMDPRNPNLLFAAIWEAHRKFWTLSSGGEDSGLWRSTDGGDSWEEITGKPGLPGGIWGKVGVVQSPAQTGRIWAIVEAHERGLFRSDDNGESWQKLCDKAELHARPWYFHHLIADPVDANRVYMMGLRAWRSDDGGSNWSQILTTHGDNHALWIDPVDNRRMINGNDGGASVSFNNGNSWSTVYNQPTAQFYRVTTDNQFPYRVYGTQQDNSNMSVPSRTGKGGIPWQDCYSAGTGESGHVAVHPDDPNIVFCGAIGSSPGGGGALQRYDHRTGQIRLVTIYPETYRGYGAKDWKYRFQWTYPISFSPHDSGVLYAAGNHLFKTTNEGQSWEVISPDLTRADPDKLVAAGGPISNDTTGAENYATIYAFMESALEPGVLWTGSDDGLVHISRDGGASWQNVTPPEMPEWTMIHSLDISPNQPGTVYLACTRYKMDDFAPYLYKSSDYGTTWEKIVDGLPADEFTRVIREYPGRPGLLLAGTELGVHVSFDDGASWQPAQGNLPVSPVYDMVFKDGDLVVATHGRSFWILDGATLIQQIGDNLADQQAHLFQPAPAYRFPDLWFGRTWGVDQGKAYMLGLGNDMTFNIGRDRTGMLTRDFLDSGSDPDNGVHIYYYLKDGTAQSVQLTISDSAGAEIISFRNVTSNGRQLTMDAGLNRFVWDMRYPPATKLTDGPNVEVRGPKAVPGSYKLRLTVDGVTSEASCEIRKIPTVAATQAELQEQFEFLIAIRDRLSECHEAINRIRVLRRQVDGWLGRGEAALTENGQAVMAKLVEIEEALINREGIERYMFYETKLSGKLAGMPILVANADFKPTDQAREVFADLEQRLGAQLARLERVVSDDIGQFNQLVQASGLLPVAAD